MLSVNSELFKFCISVKLLWIAFIAAWFVEILLVVSHPVTHSTRGDNEMTHEEADDDICTALHGEHACKVHSTAWETSLQGVSLHSML